MSLRQSIVKVLSPASDNGHTIAGILEELHGKFPADEPAHDPVTRILLVLTNLTRTGLVVPLMNKRDPNSDPLIPPVIDPPVAMSRWRLTETGRRTL
jgi:hypothetical protein